MGHLLTVAKQRLLGQEIRNTFWWGGNDATMANAQAIIDEMADAWEVEIKANLVPEWTLYEFDVYDKTIPSVPGLQFLPTAGAVVGTNANDLLPTQIACLVTYKAQVAPPNSNRKYLGGFSDNAIVNGLYTAPFITTISNWAQRMLDLPTATGLAVVLEVVLLLPDGTVSGGNPLEYFLVRDNPATQRRRRIGVGI